MQWKKSDERRGGGKIWMGWTSEGVMAHLHAPSSFLSFQAPMYAILPNEEDISYTKKAIIEKDKLGYGLWYRILLCYLVLPNGSCGQLKTTYVNMTEVNSSKIDM